MGFRIKSYVELFNVESGKGEWNVFMVVTASNIS